MQGYPGCIPEILYQYNGGKTIKQEQEKAPGSGTYQERFSREWEQATESLKRSGADLGRIRLSGVHRNYTKYAGRPAGRRAERQEPEEEI